MNDQQWMVLLQYLGTIEQRLADIFFELQDQRQQKESDDEVEV